MAATPVSVKIKLVQVTPDAFRKCNTPKPLLGTPKLKLNPVTGTQLPVGQPIGSRIIMPGSMLLAFAAARQSTITTTSTNIFIEVRTTKLLTHTQAGCSNWNATISNEVG